MQIQKRWMHTVNYHRNCVPVGWAPKLVEVSEFQVLNFFLVRWQGSRETYNALTLDGYGSKLVSRSPRRGDRGVGEVDGEVPRSLAETGSRWTAAFECRF